jgi:hypothetical protein
MTHRDLKSDIDREAPTPRESASWRLWQETAQAVARGLYTAGDETLHREALELAAFAETWPASTELPHADRWRAQQRIMELREIARQLIGAHAR